MSKVTGVVHLIEPTKEYGEKGFRKRMVVLEQDKGSFINYIPLDFTRDACDDADQLKVGDEVEVMYRLGGRRWQKDEASDVRYFLSAEAQGFEVLSRSAGSSAGEEDTPF